MALKPKAKKTGDSIAANSKKATFRTVDKIATAKSAAKTAAKQVTSNMKTGRKADITDNYTRSMTAAQRTADLNKLNSASKTAGRAKNVASKLAKAKKTK